MQSLENPIEFFYLLLQIPQHSRNSRNAECLVGFLVWSLSTCLFSLLSRAVYVLFCSISFYLLYISKGNQFDYFFPAILKQYCFSKEIIHIFPGMKDFNSEMIGTLYHSFCRAV